MFDSMFPPVLKPEAILKSTNLAAAVKAHWGYSKYFAIIFLVSNLPILFLLHSPSLHIIEYAITGLLILFIGLPIIELTKAALIRVIGKIYRGFRYSYEQVAITTLYSSFPMIIFYPLLAFIFINFLISPVVSSSNLVSDLVYQLALLSGVTFFFVPITALPILWKLAVCAKTLSKKQKMDVSVSLAISAMGLILVILLFGVLYSYITIVLSSGTIAGI